MVVSIDPDNLTYRQKRVKWLQELKSNTPCKDCGQTYEPYCMDYDHLRDKISSVSRMVLDNTPKDKILEEIKKCELVCVLCHNTRTRKRFDETNNKTIKPRFAKIKNLEIIAKEKEKPCYVCNLVRDPWNVEFDHANPLTKHRNICNLISHKTVTLEEELKKCKPICSLCHRRKSILEQKENKYPEKRIIIKKIKLFYDPITHTKECGLCHDIKHGSLFPNKADTISKLNTYCKECFNKYCNKRKKNLKQRKMMHI